MTARISSFLGAARDATAERLFVLTHPPSGLAHRDPTATPATIDRAIDLGLDYLAKTQRRDGAWTDFLLCPGASIEWITAHVAFVLESVPAARSLTTRAAAYLASVGANDGGWGYCRRVANDCDSTAQALMVLHDHGIEAPRFIVEWLLAGQAPSGGFPTYPKDVGLAAKNGWQREHADVTLMVIEAMRRLGLAPEQRERALRWLHASAPKGLIKSYWWPSPAYAAWLQTRVGFRAEQAARNASALIGEERWASELAMLVAAARSDEKHRRGAQGALTTLLAQQWRDGSWPCSRVLRVTDPNAPDDALSGPGFAGARRAFSTAHSVAALAAAKLAE
jgi:hypothetical protein